MNQTKKRSDPARGAKTLITAGAIAATLGGWAVLSLGDAQANASTANNPVAAVQAPAQAPSAGQPSTPRRGRFGRNGQPSFGGSTAPNTVPQPNFGNSTDPNAVPAPDFGGATDPGTGGSTTPSFGGSSGSTAPSTTFPRARTRSSR